MKSLTFIMAFLSLLNLMMVVLATEIHTTYPRPSTTLVTVPVNNEQPHRQNVARDPPTPAPSTTPGPGQNVVDYNLRNPSFRIPPYVLLPRDGNILQDPSTGWPGGRDNPQVGGRALEVMFSADEVWTAFNQAWQHLRDASNAGGYYTGIPPFTTANQEFWNYASSHWPRWQAGQYFPSEVPSDIWDNIFDWAGWPNEEALHGARIFLYPLTFQGHFDGGDSAPANSNERVIAPGEYRVVFTDTGTYLGVVRYRPGLPNAYGILLRTTPRNFLRASWLAPVDARQLSVAAQDAAGRWNYPGVPLWASQLPENYLPPLNVALATVLLQRWNRLAHPGGSQPPPRRDHGALYLPGVDDNNTDSARINTHGFYQFDANLSGDSPTDPAIERIRNLRCSNALVAVNRTFQVSCESQQDYVNHNLGYHIAVTGIGEGGYHAQGWCKGIMDNMKRYCNKWDFNMVGEVNCNTGNASLATWFMDNRLHDRHLEHVDGIQRNYGDYLNHVDGIEMWFTLRPPWDSTDNNHECVAKAIQQGSCVSRGMQPLYPVTCRSKNFVDLELNEWSWADLGEADR